MENKHIINSALLVFLIILTVRVASVIFTLSTGLNPYAQADIFGFLNAAEIIAEGLREGVYVDTGYSTTNQRWGTVLAPFLLLPGPSLLYASLVNAILGSVAIYNVYVIARYYHSHRAGIFAIIPLTFFPSIIMLHGTPIREATILFGLTLTARVLLVRDARSRTVTLGIVMVGLTMATYPRADNLIIYLLAIAVGIVVYMYRVNLLREFHIYLGITFTAFVLVLMREYIYSGFAYLAHLRSVRARGRTAFLPDVVPTTIPEIIAFAPIGMAYFLFAPFPWMIENWQDFVVSMEGVVTFGFLLAAPFGVRRMYHRSPDGTLGLLAGFSVAVLLYGFGTGNIGTGVRHRQMFTWIIFLFGGIGIADHIRLRIGTPAIDMNHHGTDTDSI